MKALFAFLFGIVVWLVTYQKSYAQANELAQLALNIEKLAQFKQILTDLKKGYEIVSSGYGTIKDISEGNFNIHKVFLDGLMEVSPAVKKYYKIAQIADYQIELAKQYKAAYKKFAASNQFSSKEINYISAVYKNLINQSLENLDELINVTTAGKLRMSDADRIKAIDRIYDEMEDKLTFLKEFNQDTNLMLLGRLKESHEVTELKRIHGIN